MTGVAGLAFAGAAGLALGSFAVTGGLRASQGRSVWTGRSSCDSCGRVLGFAATVPVVSFVAAAGSCRACRSAIDPLHPAGEVAGALVLVSSFAAADGVRAMLLSALGLVLIAAVAVDIRVRRLPDALTGAAVLLCLALSALRSPQAILTGVLAALVTVALLLAVRAAGARRRGDPGLGLGDVKLMAGLALWLGLETPWMVVAASAVGLALMGLLRPADRRLPFGPAIALAAWAVGLCGEAWLWPTTT